MNTININTINNMMITIENMDQHIAVVLLEYIKARATISQKIINGTKKKEEAQILINRKIIKASGLTLEEIKEKKILAIAAQPKSEVTVYTSIPMSIDVLGTPVNIHFMGRIPKKPALKKQKKAIVKKEKQIKISVPKKAKKNAPIVEEPIVVEAPIIKEPIQHHVVTNSYNPTVEMCFDFDFLERKRGTPTKNIVTEQFQINAYNNVLLEQCYDTPFVANEKGVLMILRTIDIEQLAIALTKYGCHHDKTTGTWNKLGIMSLLRFATNNTQDIYPITFERRTVVTNTKKFIQNADMILLNDCEHRLSQLSIDESIDTLHPLIQMITMVRAEISRSLPARREAFNQQAMASINEYNNRLYHIA